MDNLLKLTWSEGDGFVASQLFRREDTTREQFMNDLFAIIQKYGNDYLESNPGYYKSSTEWIAFVIPKMEERGYEIVKPVANSIHLNTTCILKDYDKEEWQYVCGKELFQKAVTLNEQIDEQVRNNYIQGFGYRNDTAQK